MTLAYTALYVSGTSSDTKPTSVPTNRLFLETDTRKWFIYDGATWNEVTSL